MGKSLVEKEPLYIDVPPTRLRNRNEKFRKAKWVPFWVAFADFVFCSNTSTAQARTLHRPWQNWYMRRCPLPGRIPRRYSRASFHMYFAGCPPAKRIRHTDCPSAPRRRRRCRGGHTGTSKCFFRSRFSLRSPSLCFLLFCNILS